MLFSSEQLPEANSAPITQLIVCDWLSVPDVLLHKLLSILTKLPVLMSLHKYSYLVFI